MDVIVWYTKFSHTAKEPYFRKKTVYYVVPQSLVVVVVVVAVAAGATYERHHLTGYRNKPMFDIMALKHKTYTRAF